MADVTQTPQAARQSPTSPSVPVVALVGNPNIGKTALFNALTGFRRHVANYPGVTVELARGRVRGLSQSVELLDLPGTYSLVAASPDETIVCRALCGDLPAAPRPSVILAIVDASNIQRNLYLVSQLLDLGLPVVVALNMMDVAAARGIEIDVERLSERLGVPVVPVVAVQERTIEPLRAALVQSLNAPPPQVRTALPPALVDEAERLSAARPDLSVGRALRILVDREGHAERDYIRDDGDLIELTAARQRLEAAGIDPAPDEVRARYRWVAEVLREVVQRHVVGRSWSDRLDALVTHRVGGLLILLLVLYGLFYSIYAGAGPFMDAIEYVFGAAGAAVSAVLPDGIVQSLVVNGLISGVGSVLVFLPQILILFAFIAILEDCGYLARAAFMVDRLMRPVGLSGRAFIPLLSSFACAVPAIMGTRAIADRRERILTMLIAPFMSCSARLPVYILLIGAFVAPTSWLGGWLRLDALVMLGMYLVGAIVAIPVAFILRKTVFGGPAAPFLLELPSYKRPRLRTIYQRVFLAGRSFVVRAGTVILLVNFIVWALGYFPRSDATAQRVRQHAAAQNWSAEQTDAELAGAYLRESYLGRMGRAIEPVIKPLGWDWRIGVGVVASFPAREVIVATLGTVLNLGDEGSDEPRPLREAVRGMRWPDTGEKVFTLPVALSVMVFFALCAQCSATLVTMGRESGSWGWPVLSFILMTTLAYFAAWGVSAGGTALGL